MLDTSVRIFVYQLPDLPSSRLPDFRTSGLSDFPTPRLPRSGASVVRRLCALLTCAYHVASLLRRSPARRAPGSGGESFGQTGILN